MDRTYIAELTDAQDRVQLVTVTLSADALQLGACPWKAAYREACLLNFAHGSDLHVESVVREGTSMPIDCYQAQRYRAWMRG